MVGESFSGAGHSSPSSPSAIAPLFVALAGSKVECALLGRALLPAPEMPHAVLGGLRHGLVEAAGDSPCEVGKGRATWATLFGVAELSAEVFCLEVGEFGLVKRVSEDEVEERLGLTDDQRWEKDSGESVRRG